MCDSVRNPHSDGLVPQVRKRRRFMRSTQHSGRKHRTGKAYSSNHNDRKFSSEADNIDRKKTPDNIVWTWYDKFETSEDGSPLHSIDEVELVFYQERYGKQLASTNEKYIKTRHKERVKSMDAWRKQVKHAPEEVITQIGKMNDHPDLNLFTECFKEYLDELEKWNKTHGNVMHILDWSLHQDEIGAPHTHIRRVWDYYNPKTKQFELGQEKALEAAGVPLPHPDKTPGRFNNRKMTFDAEMRIVWQNICKEHGLEIETIPLPKNEVGMSLDQKIRQNEEERRQKEIEAEQKLKDAEEKKKALEIEEEKIRQQQQLLDEITIQQEKKEKELQSREEIITITEDQIAEEKKDINFRLNEVMDRETFIEKKESEILNLETEVKNREQAVESREKDVVIQENEIAENKKQLVEWEKLAPQDSKEVIQICDDILAPPTSKNDKLEARKIRKPFNIMDFVNKAKTALIGAWQAVKHWKDRALKAEDIVNAWRQRSPKDLEEIAQNMRMKNCRTINEYRVIIKQEEKKKEQNLKQDNDGYSR